MSEPRRFTSSELAKFQRCRRAWWLTYYRRLGLARDEDAVSAAKLGTLVHLGLEAYYAGGGTDGGMSAVRDRVASDLAALVDSEQHSRAEKVQKQGDLAVTMLEGYFEWLEDTGEDAHLETVGVEERIDVPIPGLPGYHLLGKLDRRVRRRTDNARLFIDHKTTKSFNANLYSRFRMAPQFKHYHVLEYLDLLDRKARGEALPEERTDGTIVNLLRTVGRGPRSKPPFYDRLEVRHNVETLRTYWAQAMGQILRIVEAERALDAGADHHEVVPPNVTRDCDWDCPHRAVCPLFDDGSDVEAVLALSHKEIDPLARYDEAEDDGPED